MACEHAHGDEELIKKIKELPLSQRVKVVALYHYTKRKSVLDDELEAKTKSLQKEFDLKALPIYQTQSELITGQRAPTGEELTNLQTYLDGETVNTDVVGPVENFWGKAITNCRAIQEHLNPDGPNDKDSEVLKHLTKVEVRYVENSDDFTLVFTFRENEYFTNNELTKKFYFKEKTQATQASQDHHDHDHHHDDEDFPSKTEGTEIQWKEGKDVTKKTVSKKQKNKKTGATRTVNKQVQADSFFNFFRTVSFEDTAEADDDEEAAGSEEKLEIDYEVGRTFTDELIPFSLEYYLGINPEEEDEFDDEDDDKGDDDEDEDSDDDKKKKQPRKKSGDSSKGKKDKKEGGDQPPQQECKQQ